MGKVGEDQTMKVINFKKRSSLSLEQQEINKLAELIDNDRKNIIGLLNHLQKIESDINSFLDQNYGQPASNLSAQEINALYHNLIEFIDSELLGQKIQMTYLESALSDLIKIENYISGSSACHLQTPAEKIAVVTGEYDELLDKIREKNATSDGLKKAFSSAKLYEDEIITEIKDTIRNNLQDALI